MSPERQQLVLVAAMVNAMAEAGAPPEDMCPEAIGDLSASFEAMRRAERWLVGDDMVPDWVAYVVDVVQPHPGWEGTGRIQAARYALSATLEQRREALVRTLCLWEE